MAAFFGLVPSGIVVINASRKSQQKPSSPSLRQEEHAVLRTFTLNLPFILGAAASLFVYFFILGYMPNSWEYFVASRISHNAQLIATTSAALCKSQWKTYTCPEVGWATFTTKTAFVSDALCLKFYPSNVIFFCYLLLLLFIAASVRTVRGARVFVKRPIRIPALGVYTVGDIAFLLGAVSMLALFFFYWVHDHNFNGSWTGGDDPGMATSERWARAFGQLAVAFMSLLFFPASRTSCLHELFSSSWEASLWLHRLLGCGMLAASFAHMVSWYIRYAEVGHFPHDVFYVPSALPTSIDNFTVPQITLTTWLMFLCMGVFAMPPIRRRFFELFYYSHVFAAYVSIPAVLWHAAAAWEYLLPGLTVWFVDQVMSVGRTADLVVVTDVQVLGDVTAITFRKDMVVRPGQYVFVNISELSLLEWHPFTISSGTRSEFTCHIKSMGAETWSGRLNALRRGGSCKFAIGVDGPYGTPVDFADFKRIVFVVGGIGVTPSMSIISSPQVPLHKDLLWVVRDSDMVEAFAPALLDACTASTASTPLRASCGFRKAFVTRGGDNTKAFVPGFEVCHGRPKICDEFACIARQTLPDHVLIFACGPETLVADARAAAMAQSFHFHQETFLL
eukprot:TRINITY_DN15630_c0_g3_i1.p1 TRINITY_DN15630_c0_g3~~TRINITY_DN15630_c0_g3_i1.p1  ORF type:complete len:654 (-),score=51.78 TRINITY_DN15630_c0_g3_i1:46-1902(-)